MNNSIPSLHAASSGFQLRRSVRPFEVLLATISCPRWSNRNSEIVGMLAHPQHQAHRVVALVVHSSCSVQWQKLDIDVISRLYFRASVHPDAMKDQAPTPGPSVLQTPIQPLKPEGITSCRDFTLTNVLVQVPNSQLLSERRHRSDHRSRPSLCTHQPAPSADENLS